MENVNRESSMCGAQGIFSQSHNRCILNWAVDRLPKLWHFLIHSLWDVALTSRNFFLHSVGSYNNSQPSKLVFYYTVRCQKEYTNTFGISCGPKSLAGGNETFCNPEMRNSFNYVLLWVSFITAISWKMIKVVLIRVIN